MDNLSGRNRRYYSWLFGQRSILGSLAMKNMGAEPKRVELQQSVACIQFWDEQSVFCGLEGGALVYLNINTATFEQINDVHYKTINRIACNRAKNAMVTCSDDTFIKLSKIQETGYQVEREFIGHSSFVTWCDISEQADKVVSCSTDSTIRLWHKDMREHVIAFDVDESANSVQFMPSDPFYILSSHPNGSFVWDIRNLSTYKEFINKHERIYDGGFQSPVASPVRPQRGDDDMDIDGMGMWGGMASPQPTRSEGSLGSLWGGFTPDRLNDVKESAVEIPIASFRKSAVETSRQFDKFTGDYEFAFAGHNDVFHATCTSDGLHVLTSSSDSTHRLWRVYDQEVVAIYGGVDLSIPTCPVMDSKSKFLYSGSVDGTIRIWSISGRPSPSTGKTKHIKDISAHNFPVTCISLSPDDNILVSADSSGHMCIFSGMESGA
mmetsp:Transcript_26420/g.29427  ORF Transcript_26420/g.29427 Transcript_26420/m.29427 type:complete len:436 (+) Transcript_26420:2658-3965(+)